MKKIFLFFVITLFTLGVNSQGTIPQSQIIGLIPALNAKISFPGYGNNAVWGYTAHPTTYGAGGYGITDIPTYSGANFILNFPTLYSIQASSPQTANIYIDGLVSANKIYLGDPIGSNIGMDLSSNGLGLNIKTSDTLSVYNGSNTRLITVEANTGKVGIGTHNMHSILNTVGDVMFGDALNSHGIVIHPMANAQYIYATNYGGSATSLTLGTIGHLSDQLVLNTDGTVKISSTVPTTSTTTGSLQVGGGLGVGSGITARAGVTAGSFAVPDGLPSEFLKADGSRDSNTYLTSGSPGTGGTFTPTFSNLANIASVTQHFGYYTNLGGIITATFNFDYVGSGSGQQTFSFTLPITATVTSGNIATIFNCTSNNTAVGTMTNSTTCSFMLSTAGTGSLTNNTITVVYK